MHLLVHYNSLYTIVVTIVETQWAPGVNTLSQVHKYTGFALNLSSFVGIYEEGLDFRTNQRAKVL